MPSLLAPSALLMLVLAARSTSFPVFSAANGSVLITSAANANIALSAGSGYIVATSGILLNTTRLDEGAWLSLLAQTALLTERLAASVPPTCAPPGGDKLQYNGSKLAVRVPRRLDGYKLYNSTKSSAAATTQSKSTTPAGTQPSSTSKS